MTHHAPGLGTLLRQLLASLDGGAQAVYDRMEADFRPRYFPIARHLLEHGPTPVSQLAQLLGTTQPAISQTLGQMELDGLIAFGSGEDRRVRLASLSPKGDALCRQLKPVWDAVGQAATDLGNEAGVNLAALLVRLLAALDQKPFAIRIEERLN